MSAKRLFSLLFCLCLTATLTPVPAQGASFAFDSWLKTAKEEAQKADHIIGPSDVDTIRPHGMTIIMPGETIAVVPDAGLNNFGIQGGISYFTYSISQFDDPEVHLEYLKDSTPEKTTFTEIKKNTMPIPYNDRVVEHPDNPVTRTEGATDVEYVSLYRNDTGLPVILRGNHWQSGRDTVTKQEIYPVGAGYDKGDQVKFQSEGRRTYAPIFFFSEPSYDITFDEANFYGYYYYQRVEYDFSKLIWEKPPTEDGFTTSLPVDAQEHTYTFNNPKTPGGSFSLYEPAAGQENTFNIGEKGTVNADTATTTFTFNLQERMNESGDMDPKAFTKDQHLRAVFLNCNTLSFDAQGGKLNGKDTLFLDSYSDIGEYIPEREGYTFAGWCTDPENPQQTMLEDTTAEAVERASVDRHTSLFAVWKVPVQFSDVADDDYFKEPVDWAVNHTPQITNGTGDNQFSPGMVCTRAQVVTFLWRAMGEQEPSSTSNPFSDVQEGDYYYKAVLWANENNITNGTGETTFSPDLTCTRGQVVTFLWRAEGRPLAMETINFIDVPADQYYTDAVVWAVENEITNGTGDNQFSPDADCNRGQIVTFLYRDLVTSRQNTHHSVVDIS